MIAVGPFVVKVRYQKLGENPTWYFVGDRWAMTRRRVRAVQYAQEATARQVADQLLVDNDPISAVRVQDAATGQVVYRAEP